MSLVEALLSYPSLLPRCLAIDLAHRRDQERPAWVGAIREGFLKVVALVWYLNDRPYLDGGMYQREGGQY